MLLCLFLCSLPLALPAIVHVAAIAFLAFGFGADVAIEFAPYVAPFAPYSAPVAPERPAIRMPSSPCRAAVLRIEPRAYPMPIIRAPRTASGRFGSARYSGSEVSYNLSLTVSG